MELERLDRLAAAEQWMLLSEPLAELLDRHGEELIEQQSGVYVNTLEAVRQRLQRWSQRAGRQLAVGEELAGFELESAGDDLRALAQVSERYPQTASGQRARQLLAQAASPPTSTGTRPFLGLRQLLEHSQGQPCWTWPPITQPAQPDLGGPVVVGDDRLAVIDRHALRVLEPASGALPWRFPAQQDPRWLICSDPLAWNAELYLLAWQERTAGFGSWLLLVLSADDGHLLRRTHLLAGPRPQAGELGELTAYPLRVRVRCSAGFEALVSRYTGLLLRVRITAQRCPSRRRRSLLPICSVNRVSVVGFGGRLWAWSTHHLPTDADLAIRWVSTLAQQQQWQQVHAFMTEVTSSYLDSAASARLWLTLAEASAQGSAADSLNAYQQVILSSPDSDAACTAASRIHHLLQREGDELYEPYERQAWGLLDAANFPEDWSAIIARYPNSWSARQAREKLTRWWCREGRPARAAMAYDDPFREFMPCFWFNPLPCEIAGAYWEAGDGCSAFQWSPTGGGSAQCRRPLPILAAVPNTHTHRKFDRPLNVLEPMFTELPGIRWNCLLATVGRRLQCLDPQTGRTIWTGGWQLPDPVDLLGQVGEVLVLASPYELIGVHAGQGGCLWRQGQRPGERALALADPEALRRWTGLAMTGGLLLAVDSTGHCLLLDPHDGELLWSRQMDSSLAGQPMLNDRFVILPVYVETGTALLVLRTSTGRQERVIPLNGWGARPRLHWVFGTGVLLATADQIAYLSATEGRFVWQQSCSPRLRLATLAVGPGLLAGVDVTGRLALWRPFTGRGQEPFPPLPLPAEFPSACVATDGRDWLVVDEHQSVVIQSNQPVCRPLPGLGRPADLAVALTRPFGVAFTCKGDHEWSAHWLDLREEQGGSWQELPLGRLQDLRSIHLRDHSLAVVDGQTLHFWSSPERSLPEQAN